MALNLDQQECLHWWISSVQAHCSCQGQGPGSHSVPLWFQHVTQMLQQPKSRLCIPLQTEASSPGEKPWRDRRRQRSRPKPSASEGASSQDSRQGSSFLHQAEGLLLQTWKMQKRLGILDTGTLCRHVLSLLRALPDVGDLSRPCLSLSCSSEASQ